jgi:hypothetical protein
VATNGSDLPQRAGGARQYRHHQGRWLGPLSLVGLLIAACGPSSAGGPSPRPSASGQPLPSPVETPTPSHPSTQSPSPSASPTLPAWCGPMEGGSEGRATVTDLRVGSHPGYDRLVVQFDRAVPHYALTLNPTAIRFTGSASGLPIQLRGDYGLRLQLNNIDIPNRYPHGTDLVLGSSTLLEVRLIGDYEGTVDVAVGVAREVCPTITLLDAPPRLVLDF